MAPSFCWVKSLSCAGSFLEYNTENSPFQHQKIKPGSVPPLLHVLTLKSCAQTKLFWASDEQQLKKCNKLHITTDSGAQQAPVSDSHSSSSFWLCAVCAEAAAWCLYLLAQLADQLGVVVVGFDHLSLATGHQGSALNEVRPEGALSKKNLLGFQVHLADDLVGNLQGGTERKSSALLGLAKLSTKLNYCLTHGREL